MEPNKPTGGYPVPTNLMNEASEIGAMEDQMRSDSMTASSPKGQFSQAAMNGLIKKVNEIVTDLFKDEAIVEVGEDQMEFPVDLTTKLSMIEKAAKDARVDFSIDFENIKDDRDMDILAGQLDVLSQDKDFKRYLADSTIVSEMEKPMPEAEQEEPKETSDEDIDKMFQSRM